MITDIFSRRYSTVTIADAFYKEDTVFLNQAATMVTEHLWPGTSHDNKTVLAEAPLQQVHDLVALELGRQYLSDRAYSYSWNGTQQVGINTYKVICKNFMLAPQPNDASKADEYMKDRITFVEQAYRAKGSEVEQANKALPGALLRAQLSDKSVGGLRVPGSQEQGLKHVNKALNEWWNERVSDLNERLRLAQLPLTYHNGLIQLSHDKMVEAQIAQPFWKLVGAAPWTNVDEQIKEAIDRRDSGDRTAAFHAVCALESAIKIISDQKGWTRGTEKGAAQYIDNLVSASNGRFVEVWEGAALKAMFADIRNPSAHGPGQAPMPTLTAQQTDWAIDAAMAWVKSLIRRM